MFNSTIAAISTPLGTGGISVIRICGKDSFAISDKIFFSKKRISEIPSHTVKHGWIIDPSSKEKIDEVLIIKMDSPKTYTGEDTIEINCHGGMVVTQKILEIILSNGANLAEPGEFTKRAFLNRRLDLSQAEAVIDIISSKNEKASKVAASQLKGELSHKVSDIRKSLIELMAKLEVNFEYPEYDAEDTSQDMIYEIGNNAIKSIENLISSFDRGRLFREGIHAVIVGRPNAGKSSILNALLGKNKAIVTDIPGTTRDVVEDFINIKGIPVRLADTAGLRDTEDLIEKIGVDIAKKEMEIADLVICVKDGSTKVDDEEIAIIRENLDKKLIVLINKIDLCENRQIEAVIEEINNIKKVDSNEKIDEKNDISTILVSAKKQLGFDEFENKVLEMFLKGNIEVGEEALVSNIRHKNLLQKGYDRLKGAVTSCKSGVPIDIVSIDIKDAADALGQITGHNITEDVIKEIFSRFCLGK